MENANGRPENANHEEHIVEIKSEKHDPKLVNVEIRSYKCGKSLISEKNFFATKENSTQKANLKEQSICEICKKSFTTKSYLNLHVKTVHDEVKEHK